jgi:hypothetical protein
MARRYERLEVAAGRDVEVRHVDLADIDTIPQNRIKRLRPNSSIATRAP